MEMITIKCPECEGTLQVDEDHMLMQCPYCGCGKLIVEDKEVTLKRLDIAKKKLEMEDDERKYQREKEELDDADPFDFKWMFKCLIEVLVIIGILILVGFVLKGFQILFK